MTLDETIKTAEELAELNEEYSRNYKDQGNIMASWPYEEFAKRHCQLAEWLKDYKRLREKTRWIPVSEKLPKEEEKPYWVCLDDGYQCECRWTNDMYGFGANELSEWGWHIMDKPQYSRVVAWKPLPEPYNPKEGE